METRLPENKDLKVVGGIIPMTFQCTKIYAPAVVAFR